MNKFKSEYEATLMSIKIYYVYWKEMLGVSTLSLLP